MDKLDELLDEFSNAHYGVSENGIAADVTAARADLRAEFEAITAAAHMPEDYQFGMPSWINQCLYAAYIGAQFSPQVIEQIEAGRLTFPNAPVYKELDAARARIAELEGAQAWVSVGERLPENDGKYLVMEYLMQPKNSWQAVEEYTDGIWRTLATVTHWHAPPPPPQ